MPGVYFRQQNSDSQDMLLAGFSAAVQYALQLPDKEYWEMALACIPAKFPFQTWRQNLQVIYRHAQLNFDRDALVSRSEELMLNEETGYNVLMEHPVAGKDNSLRHYWTSKSEKNKKNDPKNVHRVHQQMQRLQVSEATEFLKQPVSENRVQELMGFYLATERNTDAETLQSHIAISDQRMSERSPATKALMDPCRGFQTILGGSCLRIHGVIALGYIISPIMDVRLADVTSHAKSLIEDYQESLLSASALNLGAVVGCFFWLFLSRQIPSNLLMACSLFLNQLVFSLATVVLKGDPFLVLSFEFISGILSTARWLFLIGNFNEDFHGGFQVATRRVALIEGLRAAVQGMLTSCYWTVPEGLSSLVFSTLILTLIILVMLAPSCYSSFVVPATNFWREWSSHKVYVLLIASMALNGLGSFAWGHWTMWFIMNGWNTTDMSIIQLVYAILLIVVLAVVFSCLHKLSVWGPWAVRDFTCFIPPGSLIATLAFWELGHLHHRSYIFVAAVVLSWIFDIARFAAMWTSILTTLANKWYAMMGAFVGYGVIKACEAASPWVCHCLAFVWGISPTYSKLVPDSPETNVSDLQAASLAAVWPLALLSYAAQILAWKYFLPEVLTYKGHGNLMPDGQKGWEHSTSKFIPAKDISVLRTGQTAVDRDGNDSDSDESTESEDATETESLQP